LIEINKILFEKKPFSLKYKAQWTQIINDDLFINKKYIHI